jgi:hypothetical protein
METRVADRGGGSAATADASPALPRDAPDLGDGLALLFPKPRRCDREPARRLAVDSQPHERHWYAGRRVLGPDRRESVGRQP